MESGTKSDSVLAMRDVKKPPIVPCEAKSSNPERRSASLQQIFKKILTALENQQHLHQEAALLSRLIYRMKRKFRSDKGLKALQKINVALRKYLALNLASSVREVSNCTYDKLTPNKQSVEWVLLRIQGFAAIFHRIHNTCKEGSDYFRDRFASGQSWSLAAICFASISRLWTLSTFIVRNSCEWYQQLNSHLPFLPSSGEECLPSGETLPGDLKSWLGNPDYLTSRQRPIVVEPEARPQPEPSREASVSALAPSQEDLGVAVSRQSLRTDRVCPIERINTLEMLIKFMKQEKGDRLKNRFTCITKNIDEPEWKQLVKYINCEVYTMKLMKNEKNIEAKLKKIKKKIHCEVNRH